MEMKFTVLYITLLSISATWADKGQQTDELTKGKREAEVSYQSSNNHGQSSQGYQIPSFSKGDASAVSIGAGYSIGGAKPGFSYGPPETADNLQPSNHPTVQLAPITLHPSNGGIISGDLQQFMSELSHGLNTGAITLSPYHGEQSAQGHSISLSQLSSGAPSHQYQIQEQPESTVPHYAAGIRGLGSYSSNGPVLFQPASGHAQPSFSYVTPGSSHSFNDLSGLTLGSGHSHGLTLGDSGHGKRIMLLGGSGYSLGGSGNSVGELAHSLGGLTLGKPNSIVGSGLSFGSDYAGYSLGNSGHSSDGSGYSLGGSGHSHGASSGHSLGASSGHSLGGGYALHGHSLGGSLHSLGGSALSSGGSAHLGGSGYTSGAHSIGGSGYGSGGQSLGGAGHSFGSLKSFGGHYIHPSKASFKPSTLLSMYADSGHGSHGLSSLSGSYKTPSFGHLSGHGLSLSSGSHGASFSGSSSKLPHSYLPPSSESYSGSHDSFAALSSHSHPSSSPPGTTYGIPQSSYSTSASHSASSLSPRYVYSSKSSPSHIFKENSPYRSPPSAGQSSLSLYSSKYASSRHGSPNVQYFSGSDDSHGAHSENTYNTIKYSEEMKPTH